MPTTGMCGGCTTGRAAHVGGNEYDMTEDDAGVQGRAGKEAFDGSLVQKGRSGMNQAVAGDFAMPWALSASAPVLLSKSHGPHSAQLILPRSTTPAGVRSGGGGGGGGGGVNSCPSTAEKFCVYNRSSGNATKKIRRYLPGSKSSLLTVADVLSKLPATSTRYSRIYTKAPFQTALSAPSSDSDAEGFVYWQRIKHPDGRLEWKAGRSNDPERRLREWRSQCRLSEIELIAEVPTRHAKKLECVLHKYLKIADAWITPYPCNSCRVRHQEKFDVDVVGGIQEAIELPLERIVPGEIRDENTL
ncbi:hypothetical protein B0H12DRAFT_1306575 [Mycena haematopus]|nr:hypothetical protein B0H12DRAFT_1306575 [Mycena haematopus]